MTKYSSGPLMGMSPSGVPGLLVVLVVSLGIARLFVPEAYQVLLFPTFLVAVLLVVALGLFAQFREGNDASPEGLLRLSRSMGPPVPSLELAPQRWRRGITAVLALVAAVSLTLFGLLVVILEAAVDQVWFLAAIGLLSIAALSAPFIASWWRRSFRLR